MALHFQKLEAAEGREAISLGWEKGVVHSHPAMCASCQESLSSWWAGERILSRKRESRDIRARGKLAGKGFQGDMGTH